MHFLGQLPDRPKWSLSRPTSGPFGPPLPPLGDAPRGGRGPAKTSVFVPRIRKNLTICWKVGTTKVHNFLCTTLRCQFSVVAVPCVLLWRPWRRPRKRQIIVKIFCMSLSLMHSGTLFFGVKSFMISFYRLLGPAQRAKAQTATRFWAPRLCWWSRATNRMRFGAL